MTPAERRFDFVKWLDNGPFTSEQMLAVENEAVEMARSVASALSVKIESMIKAEWSYHPRASSVGMQFVAVFAFTVTP